MDAKQRLKLFKKIQKVKIKPETSFEEEFENAFKDMSDSSEGTKRDLIVKQNTKTHGIDKHFHP